MLQRFLTKAGLVMAAILWTIAPANSSDLVRYLSINGDNTNACTLDAPCRTFVRGLQVTPVAGELRILESGVYGGIANIRRSVTISGVRPDVSVVRTRVVIDNSSATVNLRNIQFIGRQSLIYGIDVRAVRELSVENVVVQAYSTGLRGLIDAGRIFVINSIFRNNRSTGLFINNAANLRLIVEGSQFLDNNQGMSTGGAQVSISRSQVSGANSGIYVNGGSATISDSVMSGNASYGVRVIGNATAYLERSVVRGNGLGVSVFAGSTAHLSNLTVTANGTGVNNQGTAFTRQNNTIDGNTVDVSGPLTPAAAK